MGSHPAASITWADALGWRMERHLLDPVGSDSAADVVRRLGAVLSMDESLAELAVRTRRTASRPGELAQALADGEVIVGGVVCGTWALKKGKKNERNEIAVTWLDERQPPQESLEEEAQRLAAILGDDLRLIGSR